MPCRGSGWSWRSTPRSPERSLTQARTSLMTYGPESCAGTRIGALEVHPAAATVVVTLALLARLLTRHHALRVGDGGRSGRKTPSHRFQLSTRGHLLREQRRLDAVEQPFQPAHQLSVRDP